MTVEDAKEFIIVVGFILLIILIIGGFIYGCGWVGKIANDAGQKANCDLMAKNGYKTHIEHFWYVGIPWTDCYITMDDGKSVPYDRFRAFSE